MVIKINDIALPKVSSLDIGYHIIDNAERNARGKMIHEFIARKFKVTAGFTVLTPAEARTILQAVLTGNGLDLKVEAIDPRTRAEVSYRGYVQQDINIKLLHYASGAPKHYDGLELAFIEN